MSSGRTMSSAILRTWIAVTTASTLIIGGLWLGSEQVGFRRATERLRANLTEVRKGELRDQVKRSLGFVEFMRSKIEARAQESCRSRVYEAHALASRLWELSAGRPRTEAAATIREALRCIRFNGGRGYYFAFSLDGVDQLAAPPDLEGHLVLGVRDARGVFLFRDMIALAKSKGEGFYSYSWSKPTAPGSDFLKISYVKLFEPLGWVLGTGEYLDDVEAEIQQEALERLERIRFGKDGYVFAGTWDGVALTPPAKGRNMLGVTDPNGVKLVQELIARARSGGGYVQYVMPKLEGQRPAPKISYVEGVEQWRWYVGAGTYVDDIEEGIEQARSKALRHAAFGAAATSAVLASVLAAALWAAARTARRTRRSFEAFSSFFRRAATDATEIDPEPGWFQEFRDLAASANQMLRERQRAEAERAVLEERLRQSQKMEALGTLAGGVAHDFNNLLQVIGGRIELLQHGTPKPDALAEGLKVAGEAAQRAADLVRGLLTFAHKGGSRRKVVDLNEEVRLTVQMLERTIPKMVSIGADLAADLLPVSADPTQIEQILINLATNARDAMPNGGRLDFSTRNVKPAEEFLRRHPEAKGRYVELVVQDTGTGIDEATASRMFEPFFTTKEVGRGTGLGLSVVYGIVRDHDGYLDWESKPGRGTAFRVVLPALVGPEPPEEAGAGGLERMAPGSETILVVDDEPGVRDLVRDCLAAAGYEILLAETGEECLEVCRSREGGVDLVLLDLGMPGMGGRACLAELRGAYPSLRVLVATGYGSVEVGGAVDLIRKPYRLADLTERIREVLGRPPTEGAGLGVDATPHGAGNTSH